MEELDEIKAGLKLYGFYKTPPLDVVINWSENLSASLPADSHKASFYFGNCHFATLFKYAYEVSYVFIYGVGFVIFRSGYIL